MFCTGGPVGEGEVYVARDGDEQLYGHLREGKYAYVLGPTQLGKTSLAFRVMRRLEDEGERRGEPVVCAYLDFNSIGVSTSPGNWFSAVIQELRRELHLPLPPARESGGSLVPSSAMPPASRLEAFLRDEVLPLEKRVFLFLDELNTLLTLDATLREDFLSAFRAIHARRGPTANEARRFCVCFLGITSPDELITSPNRSPFNVAEAVRLADFTEVEARSAFLAALEGRVPEPASVFEAVFRYTNGHPYMSQRLCDEVIRQREEREGRSSLPPPATAEERVQRAVQEAFLWTGRFTEPNLSTVERRLRETPAERRMAMLEIYRKLLHRERIQANLDDPAQMDLRLAGMVSEESRGSSARLRVRNRIFREVFDEVWVRNRILEIKRPLTEPLDLWLKSDRHPDYLLRGQALEDARGRMADIKPTHDETEFLRACAEAEARDERAVRKGQRKTAYLLSALVATLCSLVLTMGLLLVRHDREKEDADVAFRKIKEEQETLTAKQRRCDADLGEARATAIAAMKAAIDNTGRGSAVPSPVANSVASAIAAIATGQKPLSLATAKVTTPLAPRGPTIPLAPAPKPTTGGGTPNAHDDKKF
jgi:AAA-like domain